MGRPVNKRNFGDPVGGVQLRVEADTGNGTTDTAYVIKQKGTGTFRVYDGTTELDCRIVNKEYADIAVGEMVIAGEVSGGAGRVVIAKMFNRTVTDFAGKRYTWEIQDDSTQTVLALTPVV